ncbi:hypothetical protein [Vibrio phage phiKT1024]|nr:hypothetical protein [Vibrio phage phiKT1024]
MIIEIKDLPAGQVVKHISVDISFEGSEINQRVNITGDSNNSETVPSDNKKDIPDLLNSKSDISESVNESVNESENEVKIPDISQTERKPKPIPSEMTELEL